MRAREPLNGSARPGVSIPSTPRPHCVISPHPRTPTHTHAGIGAGIDSFYEYLLKAYVMFGDEELLRWFNIGYAAVQVRVPPPPVGCVPG